MMQRRRDQQHDADQQQDQAACQTGAAERREFLKAVLERALKLETEKNLRSENQEARFIERCFQLSLNHAGTMDLRTFLRVASSRLMVRTSLRLIRERYAAAAAKAPCT